MRCGQGADGAPGPRRRGEGPHGSTTRRTPTGSRPPCPTQRAPQVRACLLIRTRPNHSSSRSRARSISAGPPVQEAERRLIEKRGLTSLRQKSSNSDSGTCARPPLSRLESGPAASQRAASLPAMLGAASAITVSARLARRRCWCTAPGQPGWPRRGVAQLGHGHPMAGQASTTPALAERGQSTRGLSWR